MLKRIISPILTAALLVTAVPFAEPVRAEEELKDSGINYTEAVETIQNPGAGYTNTVWAVCKPNDTKVYSPTGSLVLFFIDIGAFSSGANGTTDAEGNYTEGVDYDLDETFFNAWRQTLDNCRKNGCMVGLRFRYDANGKENPEPATFDKVLEHIQQIKDSKIITDNKDIIAFVETGFVGKWGEQHGGKYTTVDYKAKLLEAMYQAIPESIPITVRTPDTFAKFVGIDRSELDKPEYYYRIMTVENTGEAINEGPFLPNYDRIGLYNDGYMGSDTDLGTYEDREIETNWLNHFTENTYFGGEFSGDIKYAGQFDTYLPENAIPEMYKTRLSYINGNIFQMYKEYTYGEDYDVNGADNSAYYGQSVFQFIRDHIGYRFVLRKAENSEKVKQGGQLVTSFDVENTGFANPVFSPWSYLILEKDGKFYEKSIPMDGHGWKSCKMSKNSFTWQLPDGIETGKWNIYLRISAIADRCENYDYQKDIGLPNYGIRFANEGVWDSKLGANYLGSFEVTASEEHGTNNMLYCSSVPTLSKFDTFLMTLDDFTFVDGEKSSPREWQEKDLIAKKDNCSLSVRADSEAAYFMAEMPDDAKEPVYNIEVRNGDERYWLYYSSDGFVYFSHDSYAGCQCKWNGNVVEFRIPFEIIGLKAGEEVSSVRVFLQDSANDWKLMGDITAANVKIPDDFPIYTAETPIYLRKNTSIILRSKCAVPDITYQWYHNGKPIDGATAMMYRTNEDTKGNYSVKITAPGGAAKMVSVVNVLDPDEEKQKDGVKGDANCDGMVDMSDVVLIMQSLSNPDKYGESGTEKSHITTKGIDNGDVSGDNDGLTVGDALEVQKYLLGLIKTFN